MGTYTLPKQRLPKKIKEVPTEGGGDAVTYRHYIYAGMPTNKALGHSWYELGYYDFTITETWDVRTLSEVKHPSVFYKTPIPVRWG